jgi:hypothetical protein
LRFCCLVLSSIGLYGSLERHGQAEGAVKLSGAGTGPKRCPRKCAAEKGQLPNAVRIGGANSGNEIA